MKSILFALIIYLVNALHLLACTTFVIKTDKELVFGRNLDWYSNNGLIMVNKRNIQKTSLTFPPDKSITWISKYGSVSFNQFGKEFPFGGINEKGLVVEIMVSGADYPLPDKRPAVNELQWVQYQLDNASTVQEVIASDKDLRISEIDQELHYLICDAQGNVAVIEFQKNKMQVYTDKELPFPVLENDKYMQSVANYHKSKACRFVTAAQMVSAYKPDNKKSVIDYSFNILEKVAISAEWSIVYDIKNMQIHFITSTHKTRQSINIKAFDFACKTEALMYDLQIKNSRQINYFFIPFNSKLNSEKMQDAIAQSEIELPTEILDKFYSYHKTCKCL